MYSSTLLLQSYPPHTILASLSYNLLSYLCFPYYVSSSYNVLQHASLLFSLLALPVSRSRVLDSAMDSIITLPSIARLIC